MERLYTCFSAAYMSQTHKHLTIFEVAADSG